MPRKFNDMTTLTLVLQAFVDFPPYEREPRSGQHESGRKTSGYLGLESYFRAGGRPVRM